MVFPEKHSKLYFHHIDTAMVPEEMTALNAYAEMTAWNPYWLRAAFRIRDIYCIPFRLQPIGGFSGQMPPQAIAAGDKLDFFDVQSICDNKLILSSSDRHLVVVVALNLESAIDGKRTLSVTTSVNVRALLGKLYMLFVKPVHGLIVRNMLNQLQR